jgi:preprotein translocase subunit SecF
VRLRPGSEWTIGTFKVLMDERQAAQAALDEERDRRYAEVALEREKALKIKETADLAALQLAREIQTYKDEKANELRSQIERERGSYATKDDLANAIREVAATLKPLTEFVSGQRGGQQLKASAIALIGLAVVAAGVVVAIINAALK